MDRGYDTLVEQVRNGPPLGPFAVPGVRTYLNLNEYVVHHEDVRRANGLGPRTDRPDLQDELWGLLRAAARLMLRKVTGARGAASQRSDGAEITVGKGPEATIVGRSRSSWSSTCRAVGTPPRSSSRGTRAPSRPSPPPTSASRAPSSVRTQHRMPVLGAHRAGRSGRDEDAALAQA